MRRISLMVLMAWFAALAIAQDGQRLTPQQWLKMRAVNTRKVQAAMEQSAANNGTTSTAQPAGGGVTQPAPLVCGVNQPRFVIGANNATFALCAGPDGKVRAQTVVFGHPFRDVYQVPGGPLYFLAADGYLIPVSSGQVDITDLPAWPVYGESIFTATSNSITLARQNQPLQQYDIANGRITTGFQPASSVADGCVNPATDLYGNRYCIKLGYGELYMTPANFFGQLQYSQTSFVQFPELVGAQWLAADGDVLYVMTGQLYAEPLPGICNPMCAPTPLIRPAQLFMLHLNRAGIVGRPELLLPNVDVSFSPYGGMGAAGGIVYYVVNTRDSNGDINGQYVRKYNTLTKGDSPFFMPEMFGPNTYFDGFKRY